MRGPLAGAALATVSDGDPVAGSDVADGRSAGAIVTWATAADSVAPRLTSMMKRVALPAAPAGTFMRRLGTSASDILHTPVSLLPGENMMVSGTLRIWIQLSGGTASLRSNPIANGASLASIVEIFAGMTMRGPVRPV